MVNSPLYLNAPSDYKGLLKLSGLSVSSCMSFCRLANGIEVLHYLPKNNFLKSLFANSLLDNLLSIQLFWSVRLV